MIDNENGIVYISLGAFVIIQYKYNKDTSFVYQATGRLPATGRKVVLALVGVMWYAYSRCVYILF